jgi:hypothetical protein
VAAHLPLEAGYLIAVRLLSSRPYTRLRLLLYLLLLAELLLFTWCRELFGPYVSPVVLYGLAVAICAGLYRYTRHAEWPGQSATTSRTPSTRWAPRLAIAASSLAGTWLGTHWVRRIIREMPLDLNRSDVILALQVYARRWLADQEVYTPLTRELGRFALPTYLPATWFPFVLPQWLGFDYRLLAWAALVVLGAGSYLLVMLLTGRTWRPTLALALVPFLSIFFMLRTEQSLVGQTVEGLIIGYYAVLVAGILRRSFPLEVLGLLLCMLSRYALVIWVPLYLGLMFFQDSRRRALLLAGVVLLGILGLYVIPYLSHNWALPGQVQHAYTTVAVAEWQHLRYDGLPFHLYNGVGLAPFFYHYGSGSLLERVLLLKTVHIGLLVLIIVGAAVLYWRQQGPRTNYRVYAVLVLKLYLATFYAFLQVPYAYLATVGIFLSVFLVLILEGARFRLTEEGV